MSSDANSIPRFITLLELSEQWRVSTHTIRAWVKKGRLNPARISRRLLFAPEECRRFLEAAKR